MPARGGLLTAALATRPASLPACGNPLVGSVVKTTYSPQTPLRLVSFAVAAQLTCSYG